MADFQEQLQKLVETGTITADLKQAVINAEVTSWGVLTELNVTELKTGLAKYGDFSPIILAKMLSAAKEALGARALDVGERVQQQLQQMEQREQRMEQQMEQRWMYLTTLVRKPPQGSITTALDIGANIVESVPPVQLEVLCNDFAPADGDVRLAILAACECTELQEFQRAARQSDAEAVTQRFVHALVRKLAPPRVAILDTSQRPLIHSSGRLCKPNVVVSEPNAGVAAFAHTVGVVEVKPILDVSSQKQGIGQVVDRWHYVKSNQHGRSFMYSVVAGRGNVVLLRVLGDAWDRSDLTDLDLTVTNPGLVALARLLHTPLDQLGYHGHQLPVSLSVDRFDGGNDTFTCTQLIVNTSLPEIGQSPGVRRIILGELLDGKAAVAKSVTRPGGGHADIEHEVASLPSAHVGVMSCKTGIEGVPVLVGEGEASTDRYIITRPYGQHLDLNSACEDLICPAVAALVDIVEALFKIGWLHRDISAANIVYVNVDAVTKWHLVDAGSACEISDVRLLASRTGTRHFMAVALFDWHPHDLQCDLESLMYLFFFWSTKGVLPWWRATDFTSSHDSKWAVMSKPHKFRADVLQKIPNRALRKCAENLRNLFFEGHYEQARLRVTCECFRKILKLNDE